ncbi:dTDP-4-dehydrorhamnose reductase [bacterium]|nr:dTDP-4-dehydrorhamnose reductase [bacterium]
MRILITGSNGLLGQKLLNQLNKDQTQLIGIDLGDENLVKNVPHEYLKHDLTNRKTTIGTIRSLKPQIIVHTAAMTEVDRCEMEKELCWNVNVVTTDQIVTAAGKIGSKVIFISSDYVFDGKNGPYDENDLPNPIGYYGRSKLAAENIVRGSGLNWAVVRTIVLYGNGIKVRSSFVTWLLDQLRKRKNVRIVDDQWGNSTIVDDLASGIDRLITLDREGIYNIAGQGFMTRYEFALKIAELFDLNSELIIPIATSKLRQPAKRPMRSGIEVHKAERELYIKFRDAEDSLVLYKQQENELKQAMSK